MLSRQGHPQAFLAGRPAAGLGAANLARRSRRREGGRERRMLRKPCKSGRADPAPPPAALCPARHTALLFHLFPLLSFYLSYHPLPASPRLISVLFTNIYISRISRKMQSEFSTALEERRERREQFIIEGYHIPKGYIGVWKIPFVPKLFPHRGREEALLSPGLCLKMPRTKSCPRSNSWYTSESWGEQAGLLTHHHGVTSHGHSQQTLHLQ